MSHIVKIATKIKNISTFEKEVNKLGYEWLGKGEFNVYSRNISGYGFKIPGWKFPVVINDSEINYDNYNGSWGNKGLLDSIVNKYSMSVITDFCEQKFYNYRVVGDDIVIQHPNGGEIVIKNSEITTSGFIGGNCEEATRELEEKLGTIISNTRTEEYLLYETSVGVVGE